MKQLAILHALTLSLALIGCGESSTTTVNQVDSSIFTASNTATAKVDGMTCSSCEGEVCSAIKKIEGVEAVTADAKTGEVKIAIKEGATLDTDAVREAITGMEFKLQTLTLPEPETLPGDNEPADANAS